MSTMRDGRGANLDGSIRSRRLCLIAITVYDRLFHRCGELDPDEGLAEAYTSGRHSLVNRAAARTWIVEAEQAQRVWSLIEWSESATGDDLVEAIEIFPRHVLHELERRDTPAPEPAAPKRRFAERPHPTAGMAHAVQRLVS